MLNYNHADIIFEEGNLPETQEAREDYVLAGMTKYHGRLHSMILRIVDNRHDAEDVMQETAISACRNIQKFRGECTISTWLCYIARNRALNHVRGKGRRRVIAFDDLPQSEDGTPYEAQDTHTKSSKDKLLEEELFSQALGKLESMPEIHREPLVLRILDELSYEQIAGQLGTNVGTVKSRISRARDELRDALD